MTAANETVAGSGPDGDVSADSPGSLWDSAAARELCRRLIDLSAAYELGSPFEDLVERAYAEADEGFAARSIELIRRAIDRFDRAVRDRRFLDDCAARKICYACRGTEFWRSRHGARICAVCHPDARAPHERTVTSCR